MKPLVVLSVLATFLVASSSADADVKNKNVSEILGMIKQVEDDLKAAVLADFKSAADKKGEIEDAVNSEIQEAVSAAKKKAEEALAKWKQAQADAQAKIDAQKQKLIDSFKEKLKKKYEADKAEKEAARQKLEELKQAAKDKIKASVEATKAKRAELEDYLKQVNQTLIDNRREREAEKEEREALRKEKFDDFVREIKVAQINLVEQEKQLNIKYDQLKETKQKLRDTVKQAFGSNIKDRFAEVVENYLQDELEKEVIARGVVDILHPKGKAVKPDPAKVNMPHHVGEAGVEHELAKIQEMKDTIGPEFPDMIVQNRASLIDTLTGKSSWETVAWVLLALCILLAIALIGIILYQVSRNRGSAGYQALDGSNRAPSGSGREEHAALLGPPVPMKKASLGSPASAPPVHEEEGEQQQF